MKDLDDGSYVLGIQIYRDHLKNLLGLSPKGYIEKLVQIYDMHDYKPLDIAIFLEDKLSLNQYPKNIL